MLVLVPACFHPSYDHPSCGPGGECPSGLVCNAQLICDRPHLDAAVDGAPPIIDSAPLDGKFPPVCEGVYVNVCVDPPQIDVMLTQNIDTTNSPLCAAYIATPSTAGACVITGQSITIPSGATVGVTGNRQLILFSTGPITISGTLDAAGHGRTSGPFGDEGPCGAGAKNPTTGQQGGGGWGGSFGSQGSNGGNGASGSGGIAGPTIVATTLRGGCRGSDGANNEFGNGGGSHGGGGGAVLLIAKSTIMIDGTVDASGGGGRPWRVWRWRWWWRFGRNDRPRRGGCRDHAG